MRRFQFTLMGLLITVCFFGSLAALIVGWKTKWNLEQTFQDEGYLGMTPSNDGRLLLIYGQYTPAFVWDVNTRTRRCTLQSPSRRTGGIRFTSDGSKLYEIDSRYFIGSSGNVWDTNTGAVAGTPAMMHGGVLSPDCQRIAAFTPLNAPVNPVPSAVQNGSILLPEKGTLALYQTSTDKVLVHKAIDARAAYIRWSGDGNRIVIHTGTCLQILDAATLSEIGKVALPAQCHLNEFSADLSHMIIQESEQDSFHVWDLDSFREIATLDCMPDSQIHAFSTDGKTIVLSRPGEAIEVIDSSTGKSRVKLPEAVSRHLFDIRFSPDSSHFAVTTMAGNLYVYNAYSGTYEALSLPMLSSLHSPEFLADNRIALISGKKVHIYNHIPGEWWRQLLRLEFWATLLFGFLFLGRIRAHFRNRWRAPNPSLLS